MRARGGKAKMVHINCAKCGNEVLYYQKDGIGFIKRCYLNRIAGPKKWSCLKDDQNIADPKDMPNLICDCGNIIGIPMCYMDGRLAYRMEKGTFAKKLAN
jgi:hypothetical protein